MLWSLQSGKNVERMETNFFSTQILTILKDMGVDVFLPSNENTYGFECSTLAKYKPYNLI